MERILSVLNSNAINRYGSRFSTESLETALWQNAVVGIPSNMGHDLHRPIGWMIPFGLYLEPGLVRSVGNMLLPETDADQKTILNAHDVALKNRYAEEYSEHNKEFIPLVEKHLSGEEKYLSCGTLACLDKGIVSKIFPKLKELSAQEKNELINLSDLLLDFTYKGQGIFAHKKSSIVIFAHSYFRHSLSRHNNFHFIFLDELMKHTKNPKVTVKIALDWDMVGYGPGVLEVQELEFWYGPPFDNDIASIEPGPVRHQASEWERKYYGISATEFFWKIDKNTHVFEMEELKEDPAPTLGDNYGCRYIHSIYNHKKQIFDHFDGAIRMYTGDMMLDRIDKKITEAGRNSEYTKLFRIDGELELKDWKILVTHYLQGNPLIYEYLKIEKPQLPQPEDSSTKTTKERLTPYSINENSGIRLFISYHENKTDYTGERKVSICDEIHLIDDKKLEFIEYDVIEVKKALHRLGADLEFQEDVILGYAEDMYWNIPCIFHGYVDPFESVNITYKAIGMLIESIAKRQMDKVIAFTLSWNMEGKETRISIFGHVNDLQKWMNQTPNIPTNHEAFNKWFVQQSTYLDNLGLKAIDTPPLSEIVQMDGVLYIKRRRIDDEFNLTFNTVDKEIRYEMSVPGKYRDIAEAIRQGTIAPVMSCFVKGQFCSETKTDYWLCNHSKFLDNNIWVEVPKNGYEIMGGYWTDRPALKVKNEPIE